MIEAGGTIWNEFHSWAKAQDAGILEDVKQYLIAHSLDNCVDVPDSEWIGCAKTTFSDYCDQPEESSRYFDVYRPHHE